LAALPLVVAREEVPVMIRDPQLDAFLAAHKQFGGMSAFQKPSGFLSNAVFEGAPR
jgi:sigma-E factor negative regulatory protein RseA